MKVSICIATFKRPQYLSQLLRAIDQQPRPANCQLRVVISDNDPAGSSEAAVLDARQWARFPIRYGVEHQRGISQNRNNSVRMAEADTDFVLFVDDDELPDEHWLLNLLKAQADTQADVVSGLSLPRFVNPPPAWIRKGGFFVRSIYHRIRTGHKLRHQNVMTGTLLVRYAALRQLDGPFDEQFGLTGGEDSDLGRRLVQQGCKMVWAKEAVVWEWIPADRATLNWILQRAFRTANTTWALTDKKTGWAALKIIIGGLGRLAVGLLLLLPALLLSLLEGPHRLIHLVRIMTRGIAMISGVFGISYEEYRDKNVVAA